MWTKYILRNLESQFVQQKMIGLRKYDNILTEPANIDKWQTHRMNWKTVGLIGQIIKKFTSHFVSICLTKFDWSNKI